VWSRVRDGIGIGLVRGSRRDGTPTTAANDTATQSQYVRARSSLQQLLAWDGAAGIARTPLATGISRRTDGSTASDGREPPFEPAALPVGSSAGNVPTTGNGLCRRRRPEWPRLSGDTPERRPRSSVQASEDRVLTDGEHSMAASGAANAGSTTILASASTQGRSALTHGTSSRSSPPAFTNASFA
jgi:hypothetical protein